MSRVGFAGLGLMGVPMVRRLCAAGFSVSVWNRTPGKCGEVAGSGAVPVATPAALARECPVLILCLADAAAVEAVVFGDDGIAAGGIAGGVLVDCSSIAPSQTRMFADRLHRACGMRWVDAPVSGGVPGAEQGTLAIMAGGDAEIIDRVRPVLSAFGQRITHMGPVGSGQVAKVCNQMIVGVNALVIAEAVALAERSGVDAGKLSVALSGGFADSKPLQILAPRMAARQFEPVAWKVRTLLKDLDNAGALAVETGGHVPMAAYGAACMRAHGDAGFLDADPTTLVLLPQARSRQR